MTIKYYAALGALGALAACGGGGDGEGVLSTGLLTEVEVPSSSDLDGLPTDVRQLVDDFVTLNETSAAPSALPSGSAFYTGAWGFGIEDDDIETVVVGDLAVTANFDALSIDGSVTNLRGDDDGQAFTVENDLTVIGGISGTSLNATVSGTVAVEGDAYDIDSTMTGAFGGDSADVMLGTVSGQITNPDSSVDGISGYFTAETP